MSVRQQLARYPDRSISLLPQLKSQTYYELIEELASVVRPLQINSDLQRKFISILKSSRRDLIALVDELMKRRGDSSRSSQSLLIATTAFKELPPSAVTFILNMSSEEKTNVFLLFQMIPLTSSAHSFSRSAPSDTDSLYHQLLSKIGFSNYRGHLMYERVESWSCDQLDMVSLTILAIHSVSIID